MFSVASSFEWRNNHHHSPTVSLIKDQVDNFNKRNELSNIVCIGLYGSCNKKDKELFKAVCKDKDDIKDGKQLKLVYMTPDQVVPSQKEHTNYKDELTMLYIQGMISRFIIGPLHKFMGTWL